MELWDSLKLVEVIFWLVETGRAARSALVESDVPGDPRTHRHRIGGRFGSHCKECSNFSEGKWPQTPSNTCHRQDLSTLVEQKFCINPLICPVRV